MTPPPVRVGITLPQFREDPEPALAAASQAEGAGLDGVFVFDHMWPLGEPHRPALHSLALLGALAAETSRLTIGPLVARVGMLPDAVLVHALASLHRMVAPRLLVTLGTGDRANRDENEAYGVPFAPVADRVASLVRCCRSLRDLGVPTWVGGRSAAVRRAAAAADGWNSWGTDVPTFAGLVASVAGVPAASWGGRVLVGATPEEAGEKLARHGPRPGLVHGTVSDLADHIGALADAGASWVVCAPIDVGTDRRAVEYVAEAAAAAR
ncbi:MAG TPA: LLM class flavin-dependent oxidoreductase [Acidimicrobiales bacterium]|nr:LLM class flavin-dependent oxidoreductase [Acidimicrobiales bacterium]